MSSTCPLCSSETTRQLNRFSVEDVAEFFTPQVISAETFDRMRSVLAELWRSDHVRVMRCETCHLGFADPFVAGTAEFYQLEAPDTPYPEDKWEYQRTITALSGRQLASGSRLLDVGAGKGHFLSHLLSRGWQHRQLAATEYSQAGRNAIEALGVTCFQRDLRELEFEDEFDVICLFQVLEHLDGYAALFDALRRVSRADADLFIGVPNGARIDFNEENGLQYDCPPNHISRWSAHSFQVLATRFGWSVQACEFEPPMTLLQEAAYGAINRYIRNSHVHASWARLTYAAADRRFGRSSRANKLAKAASMAVSPDVWLTAAKIAGRTWKGGTPFGLWVHLRRDG